MKQVIDLILTFFVVLLYLFSKIGDAIIWLIKQPGEITIKIYRNFFRKKLKIPVTVKLPSLKPVSASLNTILGIIVNFVTSLGSKLLKPRKINLIPRISLPEFSFPKLKFSIFSFIVGVLFTLIFILIPYNLYVLVKSLPNPKLLTQNNYPVTTKIYDRNGILLYEVFSEQDRTPVKLENIPKQVIDATLTIEDREFYHHAGFSVKGILRSVKSALVDKKIQGGSTITQQLIKSTLLTPEQTISRKTKEIILAFWAERIYSKDEILEMYLNQVPYGGTAWGIQAAAKTYFGKDVSQLTLAQSALLAGLPAAPTYYSPFGARPNLSEDRRKQVISAMLESGKISKAQANEAVAEKISYTPRITNIKAPHFVMYVKELLEAKYGIRKVEQGGLRVITSLDSKLQEETQDIVERNIENLTNLRVGNGAALVTNPKTGEILAYVGSKNYFNEEDDGNVNIITSLQQPGSSIKVVTYAAALENGFTAASIIDDSPVSYSIAGQTSYVPVNYDNRFHGKVSLRKALGNSYNVPAVKVLSQIGLGKMISYGQNLGIESWTDPNKYGLSLTLGGGEITMLDMARVYQTLADGGRSRKLTPILRVVNYEGVELESVKSSSGKQVLKPETAYILSSILSDNTARSDAFGPNSQLVIPNRTVAVKTGTSNDKRDNWTIGYTPSYTVTVWVGNNDNSPMHPSLTSGITGATPIWNEIIKHLLADKSDEPFTKPKNIVDMACYGRNEYFVVGTQPRGGCPTIVQNTPTPTP